MDLPLTHDALSGLHPDELSEERRQQLSETADELLDQAIVEHDNFHVKQRTCAHWKLVRTKRAASVYFQEDKSSSEEVRQAYVVSGIVPGSAEEVVRGLYADTTEVHRVVSSITLPRTLLDSSVVHVYQKNPPGSRVFLESMTWKALQLPFIPLTAPREIVTYERIGYVYNAAQEKLTYRVIIPINAAETRDKHSRKSKAQYTIVLLNRDVTKGCVGIFGLLKARVPKLILGIVPDLLINIIMSFAASCVRAARAKALSALMLEAAERKTSLSVACDQCGLQPPLFSKLVRCAGCHKQVCKRCRRNHVIFKLQLKCCRPEKETFCTDCLVGVQLHHQDGDLAKSFALYFGSSSSSEADFSREGFDSTARSELSPSEAAFHNLFDRDNQAGIYEYTPSNRSEKEVVASASEMMNDNDVDQALADLLHNDCASQDTSIVWNEEELQRFSVEKSVPHIPTSKYGENGERLKWGSLDIRLLD